MEFKAVVLAAGRGSRMVELTSPTPRCQTPKCLLPVGGRPLLWYPLRLLQDAGVDSALVVVSEEMRQFHKDIGTVPAQYELRLNVELFVLSGGDDPGTADTLRQLRDADRLRAGQPLLVLSCDLLTGCPLRRLLDLHRLQGAALTALFAEPAAEPAGPVVPPGPRSRHQPERDLVALAEPGPRLCLLASEADFEDEVAVRLAMLRRHPRLVVRRDLLDAHLYLLAPGLLEFVEKSPELTSLKGEVVPEVIRAQYRRPRPPPGEETSTPPGGESRRRRRPCANDFLRPPRLARLAARFASPREAEDAGRAACFALTTDALTWRANTVTSYLAANRAVVKLWEQLPEPRPPRLDPAAIIRTAKDQICSDSVVGASSTLSERTALQRTVVGRHCVLGARVRLVDCVVMDHVTVHDDCTLTNCILMNNCTVERDCELKDCLVGVKQVVTEGARKVREVVSEVASNMEV